MIRDIIANNLQADTDDLERLIFEEIVRRRRIDRDVHGLVIPAASTDLTIAMAKLECKVTAADKPEFEGSIRGRILAAGMQDSVHFIACDLAAMREPFPGEPFDVAVCRRGLCDLPYGEARRVVRHLLLQLKIGGKLYLSILGLNSELGDEYPGFDVPLEDRFCALAPAMAKRYELNHPVCLYSERNLFTLLLESGASVLRTFTSTHGNVKAVAVRV